MIYYCIKKDNLYWCGGVVYSENIGDAHLFKYKDFAEAGVPTPRARLSTSPEENKEFVMPVLMEEFHDTPNETGAIISALCNNMCPSDVELSYEEQLELQLEIQEYQIAALEKLLTKAEEEIEIWKSREAMCYCGSPISSHYYYKMGEHTATPMIAPCPFESDAERWQWCCNNPDKVHYIIESIRNNVIAISEHGASLKYNVDLVMKSNNSDGD